MTVDAIHLSGAPVAVGAVFFRDPRPRLAVVLKVAVPLSGAGAGLLPCQLAAHDLVPRKTLVDVLATGELFTPAPCWAITVDLLFGTTVRKRASLSTQASTQWRSAPLDALGPGNPQLVVGPARSGKEGAFASAWVELPASLTQVAPEDQRAREEVLAGTKIALFNQSAGLGVASFSMPTLQPFALLVERRSSALAHRVALRCDTVHVDLALGGIALSYRGEVDLDRFDTLPELLVDMRTTPGRPPLALIDAALASHPRHAVAAAPEAAPAVSEAPPSLDRSRGKTMRMSSVFPPSGPAVRRPQATLIGASPRAGAPLPFAQSTAPSTLGGFTLETTLASYADRRIHRARGGRDEAVRLHLLTSTAAQEAQLVAHVKEEWSLRRVLDPDRFAPLVASGTSELGIPYWVDALPEGRALADLLTERGMLNIARTMKVCTQLAESLAAIHARGFVYATLTPRDVFLEGERVSIAPPYYFRRPCEAPPAACDHAVDSAFASPELVRGAAHEVDARADVWSIAAIVVRAATGFPLTKLWPGAPQPVPPMRELMPDVPRAFAEVLDRALTVALPDRLRNARELAHALSGASSPAKSSGSALGQEMPERSSDETLMLRAGDQTLPAGTAALPFASTSQALPFHAGDEHTSDARAAPDAAPRVALPFTGPRAESATSPAPSSERTALVSLTSLGKPLPFRGDAAPADEPTTERAPEAPPRAPSFLEDSSSGAGGRSSGRDTLDEAALARALAAAPVAAPPLPFAPTAPPARVPGAAVPPPLHPPATPQPERDRWGPPTGVAAPRGEIRELGAAPRPPAPPGVGPAAATRDASAAWGPHELALALTGWPRGEALRQLHLDDLAWRHEIRTRLSDLEEAIAGGNLDAFDDLLSALHERALAGS